MELTITTYQSCLQIQKSYKEHLEVISEELLDCNVDNPDNIYRALAKTDASMELIQKYKNI